MSKRREFGAARHGGMERRGGLPAPAPIGILLSMFVDSAHPVVPPRDLLALRGLLPR